MGIEHVRNKMVGRGVLLDVARWNGVDCLDGGSPITNEDLDDCAKAQGVETRKDDFVIVRTGPQERCLAACGWTGYASGDAPGLAFETAFWIKDNDIATICSDSWGCEVRPNETDEANQPWHWVVTPAIGISMGEASDLEGLGEDCAGDGVYEFFISAPPLHIRGAAGSPINSQAIK